jgi:hypothetical protein
MAERYATIIQDEDGREVISNISLFEGKPEQPRGDAKLVKIGDGPKIGMVKGGKGEAADGWGFPIPVAEAEDAPKRKATKKAEAAGSSSAPTASTSGEGHQAAGSSQE